MTEQTLQLRVYYEDTDAGGVVYYGNYLRFAERGRSELLRAMGFENSLLRSDDGVIFVVRKAVLDYLKPAHLDDLLTVKTAIVKVGRSSVEMDQSVFRHNDLLCSIRVTAVCVGHESLRPVRLPSRISEAFVRLMSEDVREGEKSQ